MKNLFALLGVALLLTACASKVAPPMALPENVTSIALREDGETAVCTDEEWIAEFLAACKAAEPTSKPTVQDVPNVEDYILVDLCGDPVCTLYIYQEDGIYYIEQPYQGIYRTDETLFGLLG